MGVEVRPTTATIGATISGVDLREPLIRQERDAIEHPGKESFDGEIARFLISHPGNGLNDFQRRMTLRSATVSVALTVERSLAFNNETAAAPEEAQATETVALRETAEIRS